MASAPWAASARRAGSATCAARACALLGGAAAPVSYFLRLLWIQRRPSGPPRLRRTQAADRPCVHMTGAVPVYSLCANTIGAAEKELLNRSFALLYIALALRELAS